MDIKLIEGYKNLFSLTEKKKFAKQFKISLEQARRIIQSTPGYKNHDFYIFMQEKISERLKQKDKFTEFPPSAVNHIL